MAQLFEYIDTMNSPFEAFTVVKEYEGFPVHPHWHYYMEIIFMIEGRVSVVCDDKTYILSAGDAFVFSPKSIHSITTLNNERFRYGVIKFDLSRINTSTSSAPSFRLVFEAVKAIPDLSLHFHASELKDTQFDNFFWICHNELFDKKYGYDISVHCIICQMLTILVRILRDRGFDTDSALRLAAGKTAGNTTIDTITEYIDLHSAERLEIADLADMCNMSYSYFAKGFKQIYGRNCKEYIEFVRISKAEDLLLYTDFDLTYISQETGFSDCSHLIKTFKKWKQITPKQFRLQRKPE